MLSKANKLVFFKCDLANEVYERTSFYKYLYADLLNFLGNFRKKNVLR